jgi:hypothetical protein
MHKDLNDGRVRTDIDKDYVEKDEDALMTKGMAPMWWAPLRQPATIAQG